MIIVYSVFVSKEHAISSVACYEWNCRRLHAYSTHKAGATRRTRKAKKVKKWEKVFILNLIQEVMLEMRLSKIRKTTPASEFTLPRNFYFKNNLLAWKTQIVQLNEEWTQTRRGGLVRGFWRGCPAGDKPEGLAPVEGPWCVLPFLLGIETPHCLPLIARPLRRSALP